MEPSELLRIVVGALERLELPYLVTGSMATIFYGEPRYTNGIDVVVQLPVHKANALCRAFQSPEYYVSDDVARMAVEQGGQFNIIHSGSG